MSPLSVVLRVEEGVQRTANLAADWQLQSKKKTWNMLGFSTSLQTTPRGSRVNFNGLFSLETWLHWCVRVRRCCVCYFFKSVGHQSCSRSVWAGGLKLSELVGFFFLFLCNVHFCWAYVKLHSHIYRNTPAKSQTWGLLSPNVVLSSAKSQTGSFKLLVCS